MISLGQSKGQYVYRSFGILYMGMKCNVTLCLWLRSRVVEGFQHKCRRSEFHSPDTMENQHTSLMYWAAFVRPVGQARAELLRGANKNDFVHRPIVQPTGWLSPTYTARCMPSYLCINSTEFRPSLSRRPCYLWLANISHPKIMAEAKLLDDAKQYRRGTGLMSYKCKNKEIQVR